MKNLLYIPVHFNNYCANHCSSPEQNTAFFLGFSFVLIFLCTITSIYSIVVYIKDKDAMNCTFIEYYLFETNMFCSIVNCTTLMWFALFAVLYTASKIGDILIG